MERWKAESESFDPSISTPESELGFQQTSPRRETSRLKRINFYNEDFATSFFANLAQFRQNGLLCDVILIAGSKAEECAESEDYGQWKIFAHRMVLAAACPYFNAMFNGPMIESKQKHVYLQNVDSASLAAVIDYMYSGYLRIDEENVQGILMTGSLLQLTAVRDACCNFILERLDLSNCLGIAKFAHLHSCVHLANAADMFACQNFSKIIDSDEFLSLEKNEVIQLISNDRLTTMGEEKVYEAILNWIRHDSVTRQVHIADLISHVRLIFVPQEYLIEEIDKEPLVRRNSRCKDFLLEAYRYHLTKDRQEETERTRPRKPPPISKLLMLVGGQAPKAITNVDAFDLDATRWMKLCDLSQRRCRCGVVEMNDLVYAVGGFNGSLRIRNVDVYDIRRDQWITAQSMDARRSTLGVTVVDQMIVAVGGFDGSTGLSSAEVFDPRQGSWMPIPSMNVRRSSVGVSTSKGCVYAVGGYDGHGRQCLNSVEVYDPRANRWRRGPSLESRRSGAGVTVLNDLIIAVGGHDGPFVSKTAEVLSDDSWITLSELNTCRRNAGVIALGSTIFAIGGDDGTSNLSSIETMTLDSLNVFTDHWIETKYHTAQSRSYSGVVVIPKLL